MLRWLLASSIPKAFSFPRVTSAFWFQRFFLVFVALTEPCPILGKVPAGYFPVRQGLRCTPVSDRNKWWGGSHCNLIESTVHVLLGSSEILTTRAA